jgi:phosphatidylglycerol:prolipoprotein diacylglycerol transferase
MHPILFTIAGLPVYSYGICMALGLITLYAVALIPARRAGRTWDDLFPMMVGIGVGGVVGARLSHIFFEPGKTSDLLQFYGMLKPGTPGNIIGLMIGGYLGGMVMRWRFKLPSIGNFYAPALAAASIVWRVGCYLGGCCYGVETHLPWAIHLHGADRHPTMLYEGLFNIVMLWTLWRLRGRVTRENQLLHLYFLAYAGFRFWLEFIRVYPPVLFGLTGAQFFCLVILAWQAARFWRISRAAALRMA